MLQTGRIDYPGALHHIYSKGIDERKIFSDEADRYEFIFRLEKCLKKYNITCFAWCLLPGQFNLLIQSHKNPIQHSMHSLLTGYAQYYNRRHNQGGRLFQNRYISVLCEHKHYLKKLIYYIHNLPLQEKLVKDIEELDYYPWSGHSTLMKHSHNVWHDTTEVLQVFDSNKDHAITTYRDYMMEYNYRSVDSELMDGTIHRNKYGYWEKVDNSIRHKHLGVERMLGKNTFIEDILKTAQAKENQQSYLLRHGINKDYVLNRVAELYHIPQEKILSSARDKSTSRARSVACKWMADDLSLPLSYIANILNVSSPAVHYAVKRGRVICQSSNIQIIPNKKIL